MLESILIAITAVVGILGKPIIDVLKNWTGWSGPQALMLATGVSLVLALIVEFSAGSIVGQAVTLPSVIQATGIVFTTATVIYKAFSADKQK